MRSGKVLSSFVWVYLLFLYLPIILLPLFAFNTGKIIAFPLKGFGFQWFYELAKIEALHTAVWTSLKIAIIPSVLATVLGMFASRAATRFSFPGKGPIMGLIMVPLVLPEIIVAVSLIVVLIKVLGLSLSIWTIILGHVLICVPFSIAILNGAFRSLDKSLEESSIDLGETKWATFRLITLPLVMPGIISSLLISFVISLDEFIIAFFLTGSEPTLSVYIWGMLRFPARIPAVMALGTIMLVVSLLLLTASEYFRRRGLKRTGAQDTGGFI